MKKWWVLIVMLPSTGTIKGDEFPSRGCAVGMAVCRSTGGGKRGGRRARAV